jgi:hypothetical protein
MDASDEPQLIPPDESRRAAVGIPIERLVIEIYESAPSDMQNHLLSQLVGGVYKTAPPVVRSRLIEHLLRPLSVLSLATLAHGVFAKFRLQSQWRQLPVEFEDVPDMKASDVVALADYVQQVSVEAVNGLAQILAASPTMAASAAAAVLVTLLMKRSRIRRAEDK